MSPNPHPSPLDLAQAVSERDRLREFLGRLGQALGSLGLSRLASEVEKVLATTDADAQDEGVR